LTSYIDVSSLSGSSTMAKPRAESPLTDSDDVAPFVAASPQRPSSKQASQPRLSRRLKPFDQHPEHVQRELLKPCGRRGCPCTTRAVVADSFGTVVRMEHFCSQTCAGTSRKPGVEPRPGRPCLSCDHDNVHRIVTVQRRKAAPLRPSPAVRAHVSKSASRRLDDSGM
jgi:hypothetical protein